MTRWLGWSVLAACVIAGGYLAALNPAPIDLVIAPGRSVRLPLGVVLSGALGAGALAVGTWALLAGARAMWRGLAARRARRRHEREERRVEFGPDEALEFADATAAIAAAEQALAARPESPWLLRRLRDAYARGERWTDALATTERLVVRIRTPALLEEEIAALRALRLQAARGSTDHRNAARLLQAVAREDPGNVMAWLEAGERWRLAGSPMRARRAWLRGARYHPAPPLLARIEKLDATEGRTARTARLYRRLRYRHPGDIALRLVFARHLLRTGALDDAAALLEEPVATPQAEALRGEVARRRGDFEGAAASLAHALGPGLGLATRWQCATCATPAGAWAPRCGACRRWNTLTAVAAGPGAPVDSSG
jgi:predicted Zn-dependent protease